MQEFFTGVLGDPREDPKVQNGYSISSILPASAPLNWQRRQPKSYPVWNQASSSACVAFSKAKQVSLKVFHLTGVWIDFSPAFIYQLRANKPAGGMNISDANDIVSKQGTTLEALMKSQNLTEAQINAVPRTLVANLMAKAIAEAVVSYFYIPINIDRIAQAVENKSEVSLLIYAQGDEYSRLRPVILNPNLKYGEAWIRHEIVVTDYILDEQGNKILVCDDSAHFGGLAKREITEDFLNKRCILADAIDVFTFNPETGDKPKYDGSIISVQKCMKYEGLMAQEVVEVEFFGKLTQRAIMAFQRKYGLHKTGVPNIGPATQAKLRELYY
jgi:hypothetical protein